MFLCRNLLLNGNSLLKFTELWRGFYIVNVGGGQYVTSLTWNLVGFCVGQLKRGLAQLKWDLSVSITAAKSIVLNGKSGAEI